MVIEENKDYSQIAGNGQAAYINTLMANSALLTNSFGITHPSQPNYIALFSGSTQGVVDNTVPQTFSAPNLASVLIDGGFTFGGYSQTMPSVGFTGASAGASNEYQRKHNPWVDFTNLPANVNMPFTMFPTDFNTLPTVSIVVPDQLNDMHDGTIAAADNWLQTNLGAYITWAQSHNSLFILTFDENDGTAGNHIVTFITGAGVINGQYSQTIDHYGLLRTIEDLYGVGYAGASASATPFSAGFVPEPSTFSLVVTGAGLALFAARYNRR